MADHEGLGQLQALFESVMRRQVEQHCPVANKGVENKQSIAMTDAVSDVPTQTDSNAVPPPYESASLLQHDAPDSQLPSPQHLATITHSNGAGLTRLPAVPDHMHQSHLEMVKDIATEAAKAPPGEAPAVAAKRARMYIASGKLVDSMLDSLATESQEERNERMIKATLWNEIALAAAAVIAYQAESIPSRRNATRSTRRWLGRR